MAQTPERFDLLIIGSGSGNSLVTDHWRGRRVGIVEAGVFGGTCLNRGCIPTKMYAYPAQLAASGPEAGRLGVGLEFTGADFPAMRDRIFGRIDAISDAGLRYRRDELEHTEVIAEETWFTGPKRLATAGGRVLEAETIVLASGSRPRLPEVPGVDHPSVHTSDTIMRLPRLPQRLVVLGGGYIAAEFASVFSALGTEVVQVNRGDRLLRAHDRTVSERFTALAARRWELRTGRTLAAVEPVEDAGRAAEGWVRVCLDVAAEEGRAGRTEQIEADAVLVALGRVPNSDRLHPEAAGIDVDDDGLVAVDRYQRVLSGRRPLEGVFALGDVANPWQLKHVANHEARVVAHNLEHPEDLRARSDAPVPAAVFTRPQIASVGLTEEQAVERFGEEAVTVKVQAFGDVAYGWAMEDEEGVCKVIAERATGRILGAHLIGHDAANLIQPLVQAMSFGVDAHRMARGQFWPHPALSEVVENALLGLDVPDSGLL
ncbi:mycothione reductase [Micrococcus sp.]|uniref:mycothione reductase n=1 Tax=Micrococcus sp. TaxID=1271 RepID=UPI002A91F405|nr:mycothione reductase [Micrococcus sp.]MDY6055581.1 mycothione reductase [Micrococcus sp.]